MKHSESYLLLETLSMNTVMLSEVSAVRPILLVFVFQDEFSEG